MDYINSRFAEIVKEHIHNERNREILFLHFVQGKTLERIAEMYKLSPRHVARICSQNLAKISKYIDFDQMD